MYGIAFYTEILFLLFLLQASSMALYMGVFRAHAPETGLRKKVLSASASVLIALAAWSFMASWTYIGW
jgi:hypothetical protein